MINSTVWAFQLYIPSAPAIILMKTINIWLRLLPMTCISIAKSAILVVYFLLLHILYWCGLYYSKNIHCPDITFTVLVKIFINIDTLLFER